MSKSNGKAEKSGQIALDRYGYPRIAVLVRLEGEEESRQVILTPGQRREFTELLKRAHDFNIRVSEETIPVKWMEDPEPEVSNTN